ncbi:MAG: class I SAM-dependent methyltransferase [Lysobacterales bacterium]
MRLTQAGFRVTGYDIAEEAIAEARQRVARAGLSIPLEVAALGKLSERCECVHRLWCAVRCLSIWMIPQGGLDDLPG